MTMNLRQMEIFRAIMKEGTITAAANALHVSQPSVSEIIRYAEDRCGLPLFDREKGRLKPTRFALRLVADIEAVFQQVAKVNRIIEELKTERDETLTLGCTYSLSLALAPKIISDLRLTHPKLTPHIVVERRIESAAKISNGIIDGAITFLTEDYAGTQAVDLGTRPLRLICPQGHPLCKRERVSAQDIAGEPFIGYLPYLLLQHCIDSFFAEQGLEFRPAIEVEQIVQAWQLVQSGHGLAIVDPFCDLQMFFPSVAIIDLADAPQIPLHLLVKQGVPYTPALTMLISKVRALLKSS